MPPTFVTWKFLLTYLEKRGNEKRKNGQEKKEIVMEGEKKAENKQRTFFSSFFLWLFELGIYQNGKFYWEKANFRLGKLGKSDFVPSERYSSYATAGHSCYFQSLIPHPPVFRTQNHEKIEKGT